MHYMTACSCVLQQDSCGEEERPSLVTVVKPTAKPRRARLLSKGRKLNNKKRGRPKKAAPAAERKKKNQSALDLLHAKTLSAAPPQGQTEHSHTVTYTQNVLIIFFSRIRAQRQVNVSIKLLHVAREANVLFTSTMWRSFEFNCACCVYRCIPPTSESLLPATSQGPALSSESTAAEPDSTRPATTAR